MRATILFFVATTLVACSSSSSDDGSQDGGQDADHDGVALDSVVDGSNDAPGDASGDVSYDTSPFPDSYPDTGPIDTSADGGTCGGGAACTDGLTCCTDACRNTNNDPNNCGICGKACSGTTQMCLGGSCTTPVCAPSCDTGSICCEIDGPGPTHFACVAGTTCPIGCPACK